MGARISLHVRGDPEISLASDAVEMTATEEVVNTDYEALDNKPSIEGNVLVGDKTLTELGITAKALDVTAETLGITLEDIGCDTAGAYEIAMLFND